ncbi:Hypothetical protein PBC10988_28370 [Planctomycetales bacterium 10988]|nr:Hypothetical protein PBC10988_28370 [Planctomycetales bacterium 10988]
MWKVLKTLRNRPWEMWAILAIQLIVFICLAQQIYENREDLRNQEGKFVPFTLTAASYAKELFFSIIGWSLLTIAFHCKQRIAWLFTAWISLPALVFSSIAFYYYFSLQQPYHNQVHGVDVHQSLLLCEFIFLFNINLLWLLFRKDLLTLFRLQKLRSFAGFILQGVYSFITFMTGIFCFTIAYELHSFIVLLTFAAIFWYLVWAKPVINSRFHPDNEYRRGYRSRETIEEKIREYFTPK